MNDLNFFAFDLHRPSYPPFYKMTAVGTTTSRLKFCPISFNNYAHINIMFFRSVGGLAADHVVPKMSHDQKERKPRFVFEYVLC